MTTENLSLTVKQTVTTTKVTRVSISDFEIERSIKAKVRESLGISEDADSVDSIEIEWDVRHGSLLGCEVIIKSSTTEES